MPILATSCYLSHVEHRRLAERYLILFGRPWRFLGRVPGRSAAVRFNRALSNDERHTSIGQTVGCQHIPVFIRSLELQDLSQGFPLRGLFTLLHLAHLFHMKVVVTSRYSSILF
jgi:hypothetical protein